VYRTVLFTFYEESLEIQLKGVTMFEKEAKLNKSDESERTKKIFLNPDFETLINRAVFINQEIIVYPRNVPYPDNITNVIKFLFGEGAYLEIGDNERPYIRIKGASYVLSGVKTLNADCIFKEIKE
jgi:hypothetical protein